MLFAFWGIQDTFGENPGMNDSVYYQYDMLGDYMTAGVLITVMTVLMMLFSQKNYIKFRLRDYQLLLVLGLRKKKFLQVFGLEYLLNWFASFVLGLLLGQGMFRVMVAALGWAAGMDMGRRQVGAAVYRNTLLAVLALMVIVFLALMTWMEGKNLGEFVNAPEKNESRPKGKRWLWMAAVDLFLCSLLIYGVKLLSDYGATSRKYDLLSSLGMKKRQRKKSIRTETSGDIWISLGLSFVIAGIYTICNYHVFSEHGRNLGEGFLIRWLIMAAGYLLLNGIAAEIYTRVLQKLLIRENLTWI